MITWIVLLVTAAWPILTAYAATPAGDRSQAAATPGGAAAVRIRSVGGPTALPCACGRVADLLRCSRVWLPSQVDHAICDRQR